MCNHSWQRLEISCLEWEACLPLCSGAQPPSFTSLKTIQLLMLKRNLGTKSWKCPAPSLRNLGDVTQSLWDMLSPAHSTDITQHGNCVVRNDTWLQLSWSEERQQLCHYDKLNSCNCIQLQLKYKQHQKSPGSIGTFHALKSNDRLHVSFLQFWSNRLMLMTTVHFL